MAITGTFSLSSTICYPFSPKTSICKNPTSNSYKSSALLPSRRNPKGFMGLQSHGGFTSINPFASTLRKTQKNPPRALQNSHEFSQEKPNMDSRRKTLVNPPRALDPSLKIGFTDFKKLNFGEKVKELWERGVLFPRFWEQSPLKTAKWLVTAGMITWAGKSFIEAVFSPYTYVYASWFLIVWPWPTAILLGIAASLVAVKHIRGDAGVYEQFFMLGVALTWLIIVPVAHVNGYIEGWPLAFFVAYSLFFLINFYIRYSYHLDVSAVPIDKKWDLRPSRIAQVAFVGSVVLGHVVATFEGPVISLVPGGWNNVVPAVLLFWAMLWQYNATFYLGKYCKDLVTPVAVVMFGPYRWVRHPIYASYMILFAAYFCALRAYGSLAFVLLACGIYYDRKGKLEEAAMEENFKELYTEYRDKVKYRLIPFIY